MGGRGPPGVLTVLSFHHFMAVSLPKITQALIADWIDSIQPSAGLSADQVEETRRRILEPESEPRSNKRVRYRKHQDGDHLVTLPFPAPDMPKTPPATASDVSMRKRSNAEMDSGDDQTVKNLE